MLGCVFGVYQYPKFYYQHLENYQVLPRAYLGTFEWDNGEKPIKEKIVLDLAVEAENLSGDVLK